MDYQTLKLKLIVEMRVQTGRFSRKKSKIGSADIWG